MSKWSDANDRLHAKGLRSSFRTRHIGLANRGFNAGKEKIVTREFTDSEGKVQKKRVIVPRDRSKYNPQKKG